jgi:hypothetical protein
MCRHLIGGVRRTRGLTSQIALWRSLGKAERTIIRIYAVYLPYDRPPFPS